MRVFSHGVPHWIHTEESPRTAEEHREYYSRHIYVIEATPIELDRWGNVTWFVDCDGTHSLLLDCARLAPGASILWTAHTLANGAMDNKLAYKLAVGGERPCMRSADPVDERGMRYCPMREICGAPEVLKV